MKPVDKSALETLVTPVVRGLGYELVELEWQHEAGSWVLRLFVELATGDDRRVGVDDCARVSHAVSAELDVADVIHARYTLEVSSPGLDRPLKSEADFQRFTGKKAKVRTRHPVGEARRNFSGTIVGAAGGTLRIEVEGSGVFELPIADVEKANLTVELAAK